MNTINILNAQPLVLNNEFNNETDYDFDELAKKITIDDFPLRHRIFKNQNLTQAVQSEVNSDTLSKNLEAFLKNMKPILEATDDKLGKYSVKEIDLNIAISAEGGISLIGQLTAGIQAGITIKLSR